MLPTFTKLLRSFLILSLILGICSSVASAQAPRLFSYQGSLADGAGKVVPDGTHTLTIRLYKNQTGGAEVYTENQSVHTVGGLFSLNVGSVTALPANVKFDTGFYLGVSVDGGAELTPRTLIVASPYALNAVSASNAVNATNADHADMADVAGGLTLAATGVVRTLNGIQGDLTLVGEGGVKVSESNGIIKIVAPLQNLALPLNVSGSNDVNPLLTITNSGLTGSGIHSVDITGGAGLSIVSNATIWGDGGNGYNGVVGYSNGGNANFAGILGRGVGTTTGVLALGDMGNGLSAMSNTGRAGSFQITNAANNSNVVEASTTGNGDAIMGTSIADGSNGLHGVGYGANSGTGVLGEANGTNNGTNSQVGPSGVIGRANGGATSQWSAGVRGINTSTTNLGYGVIGYQGGTGTAIYGETPSGNGVYGKSTAVNGSAVGVVGETASPNGAGVKATYTGTGIGVAMQLDNGAIKVSGTNKTAFVHQVSNANLVTTARTEIDNPICNGDPSCMVFVTFVTKDLNAPANGLYKQAVGVAYDNARGKWSILSLNNQPFTPNTAPAFFNVLVIKQ
ncbi:MAG: hypothetical protein WCH46_07330 [bacterium]